MEEEVCLSRYIHVLTVVDRVSPIDPHDPAQ